MNTTFTLQTCKQAQTIGTKHPSEIWPLGNYSCKDNLIKTIIFGLENIFLLYMFLKEFNTYSYNKASQ